MGASFNFPYRAGQFQFLYTNLNLGNRQQRQRPRLRDHKLGVKMRRAVPIKEILVHPGLSDWHRLQTAGYVILLGNSYKRYGLYLTNKGTYALDQHRNHRDYNVFLSALTVANWIKRNGKGN